MAAVVVAITGGVASGKSAVCRCFQRLGITIADADRQARAIVAPGQPALAEIRARFGDDVLLSDGQLDRARLRELIFSDPAAKRDLESITHPRIRAALKAECEQAAGPYAIADIPLLAESGVRISYPWLQRILVVDAPVAMQRARLISRDGIDAGLAGRMIAAQASREQRLALASDVLINDAAVEDLDAPVRRLDAAFRKLAG